MRKEINGMRNLGVLPLDILFRNCESNNCKTSLVLERNCWVYARGTRDQVCAFSALQRSTGSERGVLVDLGSDMQDTGLMFGNEIWVGMSQIRFEDEDRVEFSVG